MRKSVVFLKIVYAACKFVCVLFVFNDMFQSCPSLLMTHHADDTTAFACGNDIYELSLIINRELDTLIPVMYLLQELLK